MTKKLAVRPEKKDASEWDAPEWFLVSMVKDDDLVGAITKAQISDWKVFQILTTGSYFSILFSRGGS